MRVIVVATIALAAAACDSPTPPATNKTVDVVTIQEEFQDAFVSIVVGDTVRWTFQKSTSDGLGHDVHFKPRISDSPADIGSPGSPITSGKQTRVFSTKGDFHYVCDLHGGMTGEIEVK